MTDEIEPGDKVSWRYGSAPRCFGRVARLIRGQSGNVIGYRILSNNGNWLVLSLKQVTKECN